MCDDVIARHAREHDAGTGPRATPQHSERAPLQRKVVGRVVGTHRPELREQLPQAVQALADVLGRQQLLGVRVLVHELLAVVAAEADAEATQRREQRCLGDEPPLQPRIEATALKQRQLAQHDHADGRRDDASWRGRADAETWPRVVERACEREV